MMIWGVLILYTVSAAKPVNSAKDLARLSEHELQELAIAQLGDASTLERARAHLKCLIALEEEALGAKTEDDVRRTWARYKGELADVFPGTAPMVDDHGDWIIRDWKTEGQMSLNLVMHRNNVELVEGRLTCKSLNEYQQWVKRRDLSVPDLWGGIKDEARFQSNKVSYYVGYTDAGKEFKRRHIEQGNVEELARWIGLTITRSKDAVFRVTAIAPSSAAQAAKFLVADRLKTIERVTLKDGSPHEVLGVLQQYAEGSKVNVGVLRGKIGFRLALIIPRHAMADQGDGEDLWPAAQTMSVLGAFDSALEMFKLDWGTYPYAINWNDVVIALSSEDPAVLARFMKDSGGALTQAELMVRFTGPYIKLPKGGPFPADEWGWEPRYVLDRERDMYVVYSFGANANDERGKGDDIVSEGSVRSEDILRAMGLATAVESPATDLKSMTWLGILVSRMTPAELKSHGMTKAAKVVAVQDNSPAAKAGMKVGDILLHLEGEIVEDQLSLTKVVRALAGRPTLRAVVLRGKTRTTLSMTPPSKP